MGFLRRMMVGLVLAALSLGGVAVAISTVLSALRASLEQPAPGGPSRELVRAVSVVPLTPGTENPLLTAYGEVQARRSLEVRAPRAGRVVALGPNFVEGGRVEAGQLLVQIDPVKAEADLDVARADLAEAEADLRDAHRARALAEEELAAAEEQAGLRRQALVRQEDLAARGVGTAAAVETAALAASSARQAVVSRRQALASAEARIDQAATRQTRAEIARDDAARELEDTTVTARFGGTLSEVRLVEGGLVNGNEKLAQLIDPGALEVAFRISTARYARLLDGQGRLIGLPVTARLSVAGLDLVAQGEIARDAAAVGEGQTGRLLFARLEAAAGFRPGDFVSVEIAEPPLENVVRLPAGALGPDGALLVLGPEDRLVPVPVILERRQGEELLVRLPEAAKPYLGAQVVTERTPLLGAGVKVRPLAPEPEGAALAPPTMLTLEPARKARLVAFVESNSRMPEEVKTRILGQLDQADVPATLVERLEARMGS